MNSERSEVFKGVFMTLFCMVCEIKLFFYILIIFRENDIPVSGRVGFLFEKMQ